MDWARTIDTLYGVARSGLALAGGFAGELPFDTAKLSAALPESPAVFTRFFAPTRMWAKPEGALFHTHWESSFGPETWLGIAALAASVLESFGGPSEIESEASAAAPATELATTHERLEFLGGRLAVFRIDQGRFPPTLAVLADPTPSYPRGFLDGDALPDDGWGRAFRYEVGADGASFRLWSLGPDGVDGAGAGDDVLAR
jgi:hypothetical protein